jgi:hypothetical protein
MLKFDSYVMIGTALDKTGKTLEKVPIWLYIFIFISHKNYCQLNNKIEKARDHFVRVAEISGCY